MIKFPKLLLILILLLIGQMWAGGIETNGVGARATAMGGNYRAIANDWSAMYWNPAGLAFTEGWNSGFFGAFVMPQATFSAGPGHYYNQHGGEEFEQFSVARQGAQSNEPLTFFVPALGISYKHNNWAFGLSLFVPMGWGAKWDVLNTSEYNNAYPEIEYESDIRIIDIHPTIAYKVSDNVSVGLGGSIVWGSIGIRQPAFLQNPYLYERTIYRTLQGYSDDAGLLALDEMRKPPFDHLITQAQMNSSGTTFGANFGVLYKPTSTLSFGASVQYYADLKASGDYDQTTYFADEPAFHNQAQFYSDTLFTKLFNAGLLDDEQYQIVSDFYSGKISPRVDAEAEVTIPLPIKAGFGISYSGFKNLLLAVDANFTQWAAWDIIEINDTADQPISELVQNWNNTFRVGMGVEYTMGSIKLRGGLGYETRAAVDESVSPTIPDIGDRYNLNLGAALPVGPFEVALNYEHIFIPDREIDTWIYDALTVTQNIAGEYSMNANSLMIGVEYRF